MGNEQELGIYSEIPLLQRIERVVASIMYILFLNPISLILTSIIWILWTILIVSSKLRIHIDDTLLIIEIIAVLLVIALAWDYLLYKSRDALIKQFITGKPIFGRLGGMGRNTFFTFLKASDTIKFEFKDEDLEKVKEYNRLDVEITEEMLKLNYRRNVYKPSDSTDPTDFESKWSKIWNEEILKVSAEGISFKDVLTEDKFAPRVIPFRMLASINMFSPLMNMFQVVMFYLILRLINGSIEAVTVVQAGVFLCFILSITWFIFCSYQITEIPLLGNYDMLPKEIKEKFSDRLKPFLGATVTPKNVTVKNRYFSLMRSFQTRLISITFLNSLLALILVGIILIIVTLWNPTNVESIVSWYRYFSIGVILLPLAFFAGYYLTSIIIQHFRQVLSSVILAFLAVVLPFAINYLLTGYFEFSEIKNALIAFITGFNVLLAGIVVSQIRKILEREDEPRRD